ncbi:MAG: MarR family transcriptional regulator [Microlunatus sp.]|nr:MarR family transcriptional regulator [Microlunatus sp.]MDN5803464.1 MarR family transcriptional regulator [Microlunatus sp.]
MPNRESILELAGELRPAVFRLARHLRQARADEEELTMSELSAMGVLLREGTLQIGELAAREQVRAPSMTRLVDHLESRGLARRSPSPTDRRCCVVGLTEQGTELVHANRRRRNEWLADRLDQLTEAERDSLRRAIPILITISET